MRFVPLILVTAAASIPATLVADARIPRPAAHCLDARDIQEAWQSDDRTLAIRLGDDTRYRLELADECPDATRDGQPRIVSRGGWVCGRNDERLIAGERECAIAGMARIDAREFADHARTAGKGEGEGDETLDTVIVAETRTRGFNGSPSYCLNARHMRGWREDQDGLVVEVSPKRSGSHRYYRVELAGTCPDASYMQHMRLESARGTSVICGHPGDRALFGDPHPSAVAGAHGANGVSMSRYALSHRFGCTVSRVYPLEDD